MSFRIFDSCKTTELINHTLIAKPKEVIVWEDWLDDFGQEECDMGFVSQTEFKDIPMNKKYNKMS